MIHPGGMPAIVIPPHTQPPAHITKFWPGEKFLQNADINLLLLVTFYTEVLEANIHLISTEIILSLESTDSKKLIVRQLKCLVLRQFSGWLFSYVLFPPLSHNLILIPTRPRTDILIQPLPLRKNRGRESVQRA